MARPIRVPAICAVHRVAPLSRSAASNCPEAKGKITVPPWMAGTDTPITPAVEGVPDVCHSTRPSDARTAQPMSLRAST